LRLVWSSSIYTARIQAHCSTINFEIFKHLKSTHMTEYKRAMSKVSILDLSSMLYYTWVASSLVGKRTKTLGGLP
jgi:hypothetical protein